MWGKRTGCDYMETKSAADRIHEEKAFAFKIVLNETIANFLFAP